MAEAAEDSAILQGLQEVVADGDEDPDDDDDDSEFGDGVNDEIGCRPLRSSVEADDSASQVTSSLP